MKIKTMKENQGEMANELDRDIEKELNKGQPLPASVKSQKLTEENLEKVTNSIRDDISAIEDAIDGTIILREIIDQALLIIRGATS